MSEDDTLVIFKTDIYKEGLSTPKVEYEIYDVKNKRNLDLNICKDTKIQLLLPCNIDENNVYKYNISSDYYNDICYSYTTDNGTDIILSDRKNEFLDKNMALCENGCEYNGYDSNIKKAICDCDIQSTTAVSEGNEVNKLL